MNPRYLASTYRAFTLIELLVVIAIIGILSAVVLASLNTARGKGTDAGIKSDLNTVETQAVLDYDGFPNAYAASTVAVTTAAAWTVGGTAAPGSVGTSVLSTVAANEDQTAGNALVQASNADGGKIQWGVSPTAFVIQAQLTAVSGIYWCIDSTGNAKAESAALGAVTKCP